MPHPPLCKLMDARWWLTAQVILCSLTSRCAFRSVAHLRGYQSIFAIFPLFILGKILFCVLLPGQARDVLFSLLIQPDPIRAHTLVVLPARTCIRSCARACTHSRRKLSLSSSQTLSLIWRLLHWSTSSFYLLPSFEFSPQLHLRSQPTTIQYPLPIFSSPLPADLLGNPTNRARSCSTPNHEFALACLPLTFDRCWWASDLVRWTPSHSTHSRHRSKVWYFWQMWPPIWNTWQGLYSVTVNAAVLFHRLDIYRYCKKHKQNLLGSRWTLRQLERHRTCWNTRNGMSITFHHWFTILLSFLEAMQKVVNSCPPVANPISEPNSHLSLITLITLDILDSSTT